VVCVTVSCTYTSPKQYITTVTDENSEHVRGVLVVPVVKKYRALAVGPDGMGAEGIPVRSVEKPFLWNSGDDLIPKHLKSSGIMFLPMVGVRKSVSVSKWLLLKRGYKPLVISNNKNSVYRSGGHYALLEPSDDQNRSPRMISPQKIKQEAMSKKSLFTLKHGGDMERKQLIKALTTIPPNKKRISSIFNIPIEEINLSQFDRIRIQKMGSSKNE